MRSHSETCSLSLDLRPFDVHYGIASADIFKWSFSLRDQWALPTPPRAGCDGFAKDPNIKCCSPTPPFALHRAPLEPYLLWPLRQNSCYYENFADHITLWSLGQTPNHVVLSVTFNGAVENWIWYTMTSRRRLMCSLVAIAPRWVTFEEGGKQSCCPFIFTDKYRKLRQNLRQVCRKEHKFHFAGKFNLIYLGGAENPADFLPVLNDACCLKIMQVLKVI